jgi:hypothetical protein
VFGSRCLHDDQDQQGRQLDYSNTKAVADVAKDLTTRACNRCRPTERRDHPPLVNKVIPHCPLVAASRSPPSGWPDRPASKNSARDQRPVLARRPALSKNYLDHPLEQLF